MSFAFLKPQLTERNEEIAQFVGYTAVSGGALCVDFTIYWWLLTGTKFAFVAAIGGYVCGVLSRLPGGVGLVFKDRAEQLPAFAVEAHQLQLFVHAIVGWRGVDFHPGQGEVADDVL